MAWGGTLNSQFYSIHTKARKNITVDLFVNLQFYTNTYCHKSHETLLSGALALTLPGFNTRTISST